VSRKRKSAAQANHERWLVSYADFITLLFALFVVLFASAQMDRSRMGKLSVAIEGAFRQMGIFNKNAVVTRGAESGQAIDQNDVLAASSEDVNSAEEIEKRADVLEPEETEPRMTAPISNLKPSGLNKLQTQAIKQHLESVLATEIKRRQVTLRIGPEGLVVSLREMGFFDSGSAILKPASEATLARIATLLREQRASVRVEGHTDDVPIHTAQFNSNWELSTARATEIIKLLIGKYQYQPDRLSAAGYAEFHPVASNATAEGRRQNRRLDLVILGATGHGVPETTALLAPRGNH
jgi:chemotaxis protein MotB